MNARLALKLVKRGTLPPPRKQPGPWPMLSESVDALDNFRLARAQSLLTPTPKGGACPALTVEQARDVLRWHGVES